MNSSTPGKVTCLVVVPDDTAVRLLVETRRPLEENSSRLYLRRVEGLPNWRAVSGGEGVDSWREQQVEEGGLEEEQGGEEREML